MGKSNRILLFDNLKALLILLVVIGHFIEPFLSQSHAMKALWIFIYSFHMPLFLFVAGLVHKEYRVEDKLDRYRVVSVVVCGYTLAVFIGVVRMLLAGGGKISFQLLDSGGNVTWFMTALAAYELVVYFVRGMKPPVVIAAAALLSVFVGYDSSIGDFLDLSRIVVFLPFYLLGYYLKPQQITVWANRRCIKLISLVVLLVYIAVCFAGTDWIYQYRGLFTGRNSFETVAKKLPSVTCLSRVFTTLVSIVTGGALISLMPNKRIGLVSKLGMKTMQVYFWHMPILYVLIEFHLYETLCLLFGMEIGKVVYMLSAAVFTAILSLPLFSHPTSDILKIKWSDKSDAGERR